MKKKDLIMDVKISRDNAERKVFREIDTLKDILTDLEQRLKEGKVNADYGLQGNEWKLYKELSNLERLNEFIYELENLYD